MLYHQLRQMHQLRKLPRTNVHAAPLGFCTQAFADGQPGELTGQQRMDVTVTRCGQSVRSCVPWHQDGDILTPFQIDPVQEIQLKVSKTFLQKRSEDRVDISKSFDKFGWYKSLGT